MTAKDRVLPDILVVGGQKCGTSSLFHYMDQHPDLCGSFRKEVHYFDGGVDRKIDTFALGENWYRAHFPTVRAAYGRLCFEATPSYLFNPLCPCRIRKIRPNMRIIVILRDPVQRAISHYFHEVRAKRETLDILSALKCEDSRMRRVRQDEDYKDPNFRHCSYIARGMYAEQLSRYLRHFPRSHIHIVDFEQLTTNPNDTLQRLFQFLGVRKFDRDIDLEAKNVGTRFTVGEEVVSYLENKFAEANAELEDLLAMRFPWGRRTGKTASSNRELV